VEGAAAWINTANGDPLTAAATDGKVVLVDFWTYSCINCIRTQPYLTRWHDTYANEGLVIVGVHTPEFDFEKDTGNVRDAVRDAGLEYPIALDNDRATWDNFHNRIWPARYLIDRDGTLRWAHYGEGGYADTEAHIRTLLDLPAAGIPDDPKVSYMGASPEIYLGWTGKQFAGVANGEPYLPKGGSATVVPPAGGPEFGLEGNEWTLDGRWQVRRNSVTALEDATFAVRAWGADVFLVVAPAAGASATTLTWTDGGHARQSVRIPRAAMYTLRNGQVARGDVIAVDVPKGTSLYALTFG
jgi:thiol-disulfide isomerase/thioredoxin